MSIKGVSTKIVSQNQVKLFSLRNQMDAAKSNAFEMLQVLQQDSYGVYANVEPAAWDQMVHNLKIEIATLAAIADSIDDNLHNQKLTGSFEHDLYQEAQQKEIDNIRKHRREKLAEQTAKELFEDDPNIEE